MQDQHASRDVGNPSSQKRPHDKAQLAEGAMLVAVAPVPRAVIAEPRHPAEKRCELEPKSYVSVSPPPLSICGNCARTMCFTQCSHTRAHLYQSIVFLCALVGWKVIGQDCTDERVAASCRDNIGFAL